LKVLGAWLAGNNEAEAPVGRSGERRLCVELHRLRGVFFASMGAEETQIEVSFLQCHQNRKEAKVGFACETRGGNVRGMSEAKSERLRGSWIPNTTVVTAYSAVPMGRGFESQYLRILSRNVIRLASSIREHAIARATGQQYARRCAGRFRTARCERDVAAGRGCG
jgi:hypothetical protein